MAVAQRLPTGDGSASGLTRSSGSDSYFSYVDDAVGSNDGDSTYLTASSAGNASFTFSPFNIPAGSTDISVAVKLYGKTNGGSSHFYAKLKVDGSDYESSVQALATTTWSLLTYNWANNPKTGTGWTVNDVNSLLTQFGFRLQYPTWVTQIYLELSYTAPVAQLSVVCNNPVKVSVPFSVIG